MSIAHKISRPQVERIERLPARRMSNEPRESMNCKSCRKRKIKCNRLRPTCEACQVFQSPCIYDAVPKKRGPKTDVLEALVKRIDGLEKRLREEGKSVDKGSENESGSVEHGDDSDTKPERPTISTETLDESAVYSSTPTPVSEPSPTVLSDVLLDTYFSRVHGKPYFILDETSTRQRLQQNMVPNHLLHALYAVSARYSAHPKGYHAAVRLSNYYASLARNEIDLDEPSVDGMQSCLLLAVAFTAAGRGKKTYMLLSNAVGMAMALELHREVDSRIRITPVKREMRRRLFWTCYTMDRFAACGSKRPCLISDKSIMLKLPSWSPNSSTLPVEGEFFQNGSNLQYHGGSGKQCQGSSGALIDIVRILGITNRYLAAGGVKGDSHFPWHSLSNLSKICQELDIWISGAPEVFSSVETLYSQPDSTSLVLSKLIYHLVYCLIFRPFLPIDLLELNGTGQHQSWQIEATRLCFMHAHAIADLVEFGKQSPTIEWPAFVGYCICTAGTIHVHGAHYKGGRDGPNFFFGSANFLSREMQQLSELRYAWTSVQHQRETLQTIYGCHSELVKSLASNPMRYSPVFHLEDFFDRYSTLEQYFDGAHISFADVVDGLTQDAYTGHDLYASRAGNFESSHTNPRPASSSKRKASSSSRRKYSSNSHGKRPDNNGLLISPVPNGMQHQLPLQSNHLPSHQQQRLVGQHGQHLHPSPHTPTNPQFANSQHLLPTLSQSPFSPPYPFDSPSSSTSHTLSHSPFDNMNVYELPSQQAPPHHPQQRELLPQLNQSQSQSQSQNQNQNQSQNHNQNQNSNQGPTSNPSPILQQTHNHSQNHNQPPPENSQNNGNQAAQMHFFSSTSDSTSNAGMATPTGSNGSVNGHGGEGEVGQEGEMDPFLSLLEQLVENEGSRGGPSECEFGRIS